MLFANVWAIAAEHVFSFGLGVLIGFVVADRYKLVRRNGKGNDGTRQ